MRSFVYIKKYSSFLFQYSNSSHGLIFKAKIRVHQQIKHDSNTAICIEPVLHIFEHLYKVLISTVSPSLSLRHSCCKRRWRSKGQQCLPAHLSGFLSRLAQTLRQRLRCLRVYCLHWRHSQPDIAAACSTKMLKGHIEAGRGGRGGGEGWWGV